MGRPALTRARVDDPDRVSHLARPIVEKFPTQIRQFADELIYPLLGNATDRFGEGGLLVNRETGDGVEPFAAALGDYGLFPELLRDLLAFPAVSAGHRRHARGEECADSDRLQHRHPECNAFFPSFGAQRDNVQ